jgi:tRNA uracil 4-sulfurtransferase
MIEAVNTVVLLRLSAELSTKASGTRRRFMRRLVENIRDALRSTGASSQVESHWTRVLIRTTARPEELEVLSRVAGVSSYSVVVATCASDMEEIVRTGVEHYAEQVRGRTYAVRARRAGKHPFSSGDVMIRLGAALNPGATVDLSDPEVEVELEVRGEETYFFVGRVAGLGGLPLAVEGRAVCLLSGGFDSGAAAWMMLKRGVDLDYVFCNLAGEAYERSVVLVGKILADDWSYGTRPRLHVVDFAAVLTDLRARTRPRLWQLVLKRLMYRAAEEVAGAVRGQVIVTGESIGQVSSQTLANLAAIDRHTALPVFRPLIGFDKIDIIEATKRIGTFDTSSKVKEYCAIAPGNPATSASAAELAVEEEKLDTSVLEVAVRNRKVLDLRALRPSDLIVDYLFTDRVPDDAVVVDLRDEDLWETWHFPGSINRRSWDLTENPRALSRERTYVLYCDQGIQAAQVAEAMQREGIEAYAFRGGTRGIRELSEG